MYYGSDRRSYNKRDREISYGGTKFFLRIFICVGFCTAFLLFQTIDKQYTKEIVNTIQNAMNTEELSNKLSNLYEGIINKQNKPEAKQEEVETQAPKLVPTLEDY